MGVIGCAVLHTGHNFSLAINRLLQLRTPANLSTSAISPHVSLVKSISSILLFVNSILLEIAMKYVYQNSIQICTLPDSLVEIKSAGHDLGGSTGSKPTGGHQHVK